ncbi:hypothetical protein DY000_02018113 [Brassica cretica]|uniref:Uncharacterized protein n=1 Tax=Brassica cretica TaxID=69181 RepID=A0ABQ7CLY1_BRACR|nr:hypothetical protein DY000_02018113 [Brassica cretica]
MFQKNEQLMALANTNVDFPDVFGDVCGIKTTLTRRIRPFNVLWLYGSDDGSCSTASKYGSVKKIERVTLAELNNYVLNSPPQVGELHSFLAHKHDPHVLITFLLMWFMYTAKFLCIAEVGDIDTTNGWCYFSYSKSYQKLQRGFTSFTCAWCMTTLAHDDTAVCAVRYFGRTYI